MLLHPFFRLIFVLTVAAALSACATVKVKIVPPPAREEVVLSDSVSAACRALPSAVRGEATGIQVYNKAVEGIVREAIRNHFQADPAIRLVRSGEGVLDPTEYQSVLLASDVRIKGLLSRSVQSGVGVPVVLWVGKGAPILKGQPGVTVAGMVRAATAIVKCEGGHAVLEFYDTLQSDHRKISGKVVPLAADFSAPGAVFVSRGKNRSIDVQAMFFSKQKLHEAGLFQFQPYDPKKIPVVFVHGLLSRPAAWTQATNQLLADPEIRKRYQFWYFLYPTGLPVWASAALLRTEIDRFREAVDPDRKDANLDRMVLVGHSMGGLISSLMIRGGGRHLWSQFSNKNLDQVAFSPEVKARVRRLVYFSPRKDIAKVIFVATPHRGSPLALRPLAGFFANLIQLPFAPRGADQKEILSAMRDDVRNLFVAPANSIRFLKAKSPLLMSILNLPLSKRVAYYSIIGDRGLGNSPASSDGVVPYWSSHLDGAVSEKIVPSGHGANENPEGIEEIRRILLSGEKKPRS